MAEDQRDRDQQHAEQEPQQQQRPLAGAEPLTPSTWPNAHRARTPVPPVAAWPAACAARAGPDPFPERHFLTGSQSGECGHQPSQLGIRISELFLNGIQHVLFPGAEAHGCDPQPGDHGKTQITITASACAGRIY